MACACSQRNPSAKTEAEIPQNKSGADILPTTQCIACAQKHLDEAWCAFRERGYARENRRHVRGSLRAVVLHTFREWPAIADLARECALLVQEARDAEAEAPLERLCEMVDEAFEEANPDVRRRLLELEHGRGA